MEIINSMSKLPVILLLILAASSVTVGDYFGKYWSINQKMVYYWLALLGYFGSGIFYLPTLLRKGLVVTSLIWTLIATIGFLIIGLVIFKENLTPLQVVGVILGISALIVLSL